MNLYKITIKPISNFGTPLKGDTIFGQICWMIRYMFNENRLKELLKDYENNPFLVVSDGFLKDYLPKPNMPSSFLGENLENKKNNRKKIWLSLKELQNANFQNAKTDKQVQMKDQICAVVRNSINYKTQQTSDDGIFSPYSEEEFSFGSKDIYCLISNNFSKEELQNCFEFLGNFGYGKNSSTGKGRFKVVAMTKIDINHNSKIYMSLSAFNANNIKCKNFFYEPFTRFGKHTNSHEIKNIFKKPLLLADTKSVLIFQEEQNLKFVGNAIKDHSTNQDTVHQGYAILMPIKEKL